jgi:GNAT superfamily N-acetyltransferase
MAVKVMGASAQRVRAVDARDARELLALHHELWIDHDLRGGMPASRDDEVWSEYGETLVRQLEHRDGRRAPSHVFDGKLGHVVAEVDGALVGQVEAFHERFGYDPRTPFVTELRSLIVTQRARGLGLGAALVREVAAAARTRSGPSTLIAAEVLARNEALSFYDRLGFRTLERLVGLSKRPKPRGRFTVGRARAIDAEELTLLDHQARVRRHELGEPRFDAPTARITSELVRLVADGILLDEAQASADPSRIREELIARDARGVAKAAGYLVASTLGPPFAPCVRAEVARLAADPKDPSSIEASMAVLGASLDRVRQLGGTELLVRAPFLDPVGEIVAMLDGARAFSWILVAPATTVLRAHKKP